MRDLECPTCGEKIILEDITAICDCGTYTCPYCSSDFHLQYYDPDEDARVISGHNEYCGFDD